MNILLIDPPGWQKHSLNLGLAYLAGSLRAASFNVQVLDMNNYSYSSQTLKKIVSDYHPKFIGVSVKTATANTSTEIIRKFKNIFPDIIYVVGGAHISLCGKEFMEENKEVDFGIAGEGECSLVNLIKSSNGEISKISGLYHRRDQEVLFNNNLENLDISKVFFPRFEYIRDMDFLNFRYPLLTSRGCPHGCIFCCVGLISGKKWRAREPHDIVSELLQAKDNYQISSFEIMDDNFTFDISRAKKICRLVIEKRINLQWWCHNGLRADKLDEELLLLMKKSGCKSIALGIESGDENVFNSINKGEKLTDIVKAVKMIKKAGIKCVGYFIVGLPNDSINSTKNTVRFQRGLKLADYKYNVLVPYPGTRIAQIIKEKGRMLTDIRGIYHFGDDIKIPFETNQISKKTMEQCLYLAEHQEWVRGENDIIKIKKAFNARFNKAIKKVVFIENDNKIAAKIIEIECDNANVLKIRLESLLDEAEGKYLLNPDCQGSYFDALFRLMEEDYQIVLDRSKNKLLIEKVKKIRNEYIRGEILAHPLEWDGATGRYFAVKLKNSSPDIRSANNGVIYKDGIALPFSHSPQWEKILCGKIESGFAFISTAAFNPKSVYTADYLTNKTDSELKELIITENKHSVLGMMMTESDILFCPNTLKHLALFALEPKMSVTYDSNISKDNSPSYEITELSSLKIGSYLFKRIKQIYYKLRQVIIRIATQSLIIIKKAIKVLILWFQIILFVVLNNIKSLIYKIVRF